MFTLRALAKGLTLSVLLMSFLLSADNALSQDTKVTLSDTVATALQYSPRLQVLQANQEAIGFERDRAKGGYYPQVDLSLGYGTEAHNDLVTRANNTEHNFYDRTEASIRLSQLLYDGRETSSRVKVEEAKLISARHRVFDNAEAIALDAIIAHMEVYRQRELVGLAEKNVDDHIDILNMLKERQKAGAGSISDVDQTRARLARTYASLAETQAALKAAEANYLRIVGQNVGDIEFFNIPQGIVPTSLDDAVRQTIENNPKILALNANVDEAEQRIELSKSSMHPKVHAELSSSYQDQVESSTTYEQNNQAMVRLRWNLFRGNADVADRKAAIARKMQAAANRDDQRDQVIEETRVTWADLASAQQQVVSFGDALGYNQKTLDSYRKQFNVGQRTLLDVLDARNELFQSSGLLVTARVNEVIAVEKLLALIGQLNASLQIDEQLYSTNNK